MYPGSFMFGMELIIDSYFKDLNSIGLASILENTTYNFFRIPYMALYRKKIRRCNNEKSNRDSRWRLYWSTDQTVSYQDMFRKYHPVVSEEML